MPIRSLFLSHYHEDAREVHELAAELRLRGIVPWVDKDKGFNLGDNNADEARRVIREESLGLLVYATRDVFRRPFIRRVEVDEAKLMKQQDPDYMLVAVPRGIGFEEMKRLSRKYFGLDLSEFHTIPVPGVDDIGPVLVEVALLTLRRVLNGISREKHEENVLSFQVSSRELLPDESEDALRIDVTRLFLRHSGQSDWSRVLTGLSDVKKEIAFAFGRPRLRIHGSKHLTAAFLVGRVFSPFQMDIRQGNQYWSTDEVRRDSNLRVHTQDGCHDSSALSVEIGAPVEKVVAAVDRLVQCQFRPCARLQCEPQEAVLSARDSREIAYQVRRHIEGVVSKRYVQNIHVFAAVPQATMIMLGREFSTLPSVQLYEFTAGGYVPSLLIPSGAH